MKRKNISDEDDLTLLKEYERDFPVIPGIKEIVFYVFMIALWYSHYARWFFWVMLSLFIIACLILFFDKVRAKRYIIREELLKRGFI